MKSPVRRRWFQWLLAGVVIVVLVALAAPRLVALYWESRSSNTVRRGIRKASGLGCFSCHGGLGREGIPLPGQDQGVPAWSGGEWMMYVQTDEDIRRLILDGSSGRAPDPSHADHEHEPLGATLTMPAYRDLLKGSDLDDLVAAFKVLSRMVLPPRESPARRGVELSRQWRCFSCHGPAGSGGLPNPGSFVGFIPGWYGADFRDLVKSREEFDLWVRKGAIPRIADHPIARFFIQRQRVSMPAYSESTAKELDELWAYVQWLQETDGGRLGAAAPW